jgi:hypothetical protein
LKWTVHGVQSHHNWVPVSTLGFGNVRTRIVFRRNPFIQLFMFFLNSPLDFRFPCIDYEQDWCDIEHWYIHPWTSRWNLPLILFLLLLSFFFYSLSISTRIHVEYLISVSCILFNAFCISLPVCLLKNVSTLFVCWRIVCCFQALSFKDICWCLVHKHVLPSANDTVRMCAGRYRQKVARLIVICEFSIQNLLYASFRCNLLMSV